MTTEAKPDLNRRPSRKREQLRRVGHSVAEVARMNGTTADALRRLIERHAVAEGDEMVARLNGGFVARRRKDMGRWMLTLPEELRG